MILPECRQLQADMIMFSNKELSVHMSWLSQKAVQSPSIFIRDLSLSTLTCLTTDKGFATPHTTGAHVHDGQAKVLNVFIPPHWSEDVLVHIINNLHLIKNNGDPVIWTSAFHAHQVIDTLTQLLPLFSLLKGSYSKL